MILVVMGVSGVGKSTVAKMLALKLGWSFLEADDYHSAENIRKMQQAIALDDADRYPWLININKTLQKTETESHNTVLACSALKKQYRSILASQIKHIEFILLEASEQKIRERLVNRNKHFMDPALLQSQIDTLEISSDLFRVDAGLSANEIVASIASRF